MVTLLYMVWTWHLTFVLQIRIMYHLSTSASLATSNLVFLLRLCAIHSYTCLALVIATISLFSWFTRTFIIHLSFIFGRIAVCVVCADWSSRFSNGCLKWGFTSRLCCAAVDLMSANGTPLHRCILISFVDARIFQMDLFSSGWSERINIFTTSSWWWHCHMLINCYRTCYDARLLSFTSHFSGLFGSWMC